MKVVLFSHVGNSRQNQEDNAVISQYYLDQDQIISLSASRKPYCFELEQKDENGLLAAVSDGMGGHSAGEIASYLTVRYLADHHISIVDLGREELVAEIARLNKIIVKASQTEVDFKGMGATLCGVVVKNKELVVFNVGDSRVYRCFKGELTQLTKDHTEVQRLLDLKLLTEEDAKTFPNRKAIYKYMGMPLELCADVTQPVSIANGTLLLLCSDGLSDVLSDTEIQEVLSDKASLKEKGERMLNTALCRNLGRGDNITFILVEL